MAKKLNDKAKPTKSEKAKSKKKAVELVEENETVTARPTFCQYCKNHKNHPSVCMLTKAYIARKHAACESFK